MEGPAARVSKQEAQALLARDNDSPGQPHHTAADTGRRADAVKGGTQFAGDDDGGSMGRAEAGLLRGHRVLRGRDKRSSRLQQGRSGRPLRSTPPPGSPLKTS